MKLYVIRFFSALTAFAFIQPPIDEQPNYPGPYFRPPNRVSYEIQVTRENKPDGSFKRYKVVLPIQMWTHPEEPGGWGTFWSKTGFDEMDYLDADYENTEGEWKDCKGVHNDFPTGYIYDEGPFDLLFRGMDLNARDPIELIFRNIGGNPQQ